jgi:hypothetical protein
MSGEEEEGVAPSASDAEQTAQIQRLNRRVVWALIAAAFGPLITILGLAVAGLQWKVMREQVADGRHATRLEHRAWVFVTGVEATSTGFRIHAKNMGRTPALQVTMIAEGDKVPFLDVFGTVIPPGDPRPYHVPDYGRRTVSGRITYTDVFGDLHYTRFCYAVAVNRKDFGGCNTNNTTEDSQPSVSIAECLGDDDCPPPAVFELPVPDRRAE